MLGAVLIIRAGINLLPVVKVQRFSRVIAGASIFLCGTDIQLLAMKKSLPVSPAGLTILK